jgi:predicted pyridoxine 5'-phosphate oxidase superfamily flavin-nucleotide-binding protein
MKGVEMEVSQAVWELVNERMATSGVLATVDKDGKPNVGIYGSLRMPDKNTVTMVMGETRSLANLKENPNAAFSTCTGSSPADAKGCRMYLKVKDIQTEGELLENGKKMVAEAAGEAAANMLKAAVIFEVTETRPLMDFGQGI